MKYLITLCLLVALISIANADSWLQKNSLPAVTRATAFAFSIGNKGYMGGGLNFLSGGAQQDFWQYDPVINTWTQKADFGGGLRSAAVAFSIGGKGYALTGSSNTQKENDIWEYDTLTNQWSQKMDLPASE